MEHLNSSGGKVGRLAAPLRILFNRFAFLLMVGASVTLLGLSRAGYTPIESARVLVLDYAAPVLDVISRPVAAVNALFAEIGTLMTIYADNERLTLENERLHAWQAEARQLAQENAAFRGLLRAQPEPGMTFVSARVVGDSGGPFVRTLMLNAGGEDGVRKGEAVVNGDGLVGRVVEAGNRSSRVLLLTDLNSRVPVVLEQSRLRAVLEGDNTDVLRLSFLTDLDEIEIGDRVMTSGHGGIFPAGIPVGAVAAIEGDNVWVAPLVAFGKLEFVRVLRFDFPELEPVLEPDLPAAVGAGEAAGAAGK
jgi:rod shape-determining protein MreC